MEQKPLFIVKALEVLRLLAFWHGICESIRKGEPTYDN